MDIEAIITAIIVSIDGTIFGILYGLNKIKIDFKKLFVMGLIPVLLGYPILFLGNIINTYINFNTTKYISALIFLFLSINAFKEDVNFKKVSISYINAILIGLCIGIDSSISCLSLSITGHNNIIIPIYFGLFHAFFIYMGNIIFIKKNIFNVKYIKYVSGILFLIIAVFKIM